MAVVNRGLRQFMRTKQNQEKPPKTFDILLGDAILKLNLDDDEIKELGRLTATRGSIANAILGNKVWYRESQLARIFNRSHTVDDDGNKIYYKQSDVDKYEEQN